MNDTWRVGAREFTSRLLLGTGILLIRGELFREGAYLVYGLVLLLLAAVLVVGKEVNGAKAWFGVGSFGIQPAEFAKFATALALSRYLAGLKALIDLQQRGRTVGVISHVEEMKQQIDVAIEVVQGVRGSWVRMRG